MNYKITIISALLGALATLNLAAEDNNLRATLGVNAQGRTVEIKVNGSKITNIKGGGAEAVQLYHKNHPWGDNFSDALKHLLCLREGENSIDITYSQKDGDEVDNLEVYIIASGYSKPLLSGTKKKNEVEGKMSGKFVLHSKEPDDFETEKLK